MVWAVSENTLNESKRDQRGQIRGQRRWDKGEWESGWSVGNEAEKARLKRGGAFC